jgi:hypothetical protein
LLDAVSNLPIKSSAARKLEKQLQNMRSAITTHEQDGVVDASLFGRANGRIGDAAENGVSIL